MRIVLSRSAIRSCYIGSVSLDGRGYFFRGFFLPGFFIGPYVQGMLVPPFLCNYRSFCFMLRPSPHSSCFMPRARPDDRVRP